MQIQMATSLATFALLSIRAFRSILLATQVSSLTTAMQTVAISWLMATFSTSDEPVEASAALTYLIAPGIADPWTILSFLMGCDAYTLSYGGIAAGGWPRMIL
ncbi:hypothetical protein ABIF90_007201 [Bradyrhizobium japonicum]